MPLKVYNYLEEGSISIAAPVSLLTRVDRNFEEKPMEVDTGIPNIQVEEGEFVTFNRDRSKKYLETKPNNSRGSTGFDFLRYGVLVSSLWMNDPTHYEIINFLPSDDSGILRCFKKVYYGSGRAENKSLVHGSLIEINGKGVFITGECWSGKTSLVLGFLRNTGAKFISDGNTLISFDDGELVGSYLPRPVYVRFATINANPNLRQILNDTSEAEAIQPFDKEAIEEIISAKKYDVDGGLNMSRRKFLELLGVTSAPVTRISKVISTHFNESPNVSINSLNPNEIFQTFRKREFPKEMGLGNIQHQRNIKNPPKSIITTDWFNLINGVAVHFDARKNLTPKLLEELLR